jgi:hypothetical protein
MAGGTVPSLTGFGATLADWNAHHRADHEFAPGSVYDGDPNIPQINGHTGARYVTVQVTAGRVLNYQRNFPAHTRTAGGIVLARQELPVDAVVMWQQQKDTCYQLGYRSAVLGQALADPRIGDPAGTVMVELSSNPDSNGMEVYVSNDVAYALLMMDQSATVADAPGC